MPSRLNIDFPWLDTGQLAHYYEEGRGIEGEFILSWDYVERFYGEMTKLLYGSDILAIISQMRKRGYNRTLRAGTSLYWLIVSRSRRHGLRKEQPRIIFSFEKEQMIVSFYKDDAIVNELTYPKIEFTEQIDDLLKQLGSESIS